MQSILLYRLENRGFNIWLKNEIYSGLQGYIEHKNGHVWKLEYYHLKKFKILRKIKIIWLSIFLARYTYKLYTSFGITVRYITYIFATFDLRY